MSLVAELLKLAALLMFGAMITPSFLFKEIAWQGWILAIVLARPLALWVSFYGSPLDRHEKVSLMRFGPKGFASVVYGLIVLSSAVPQADHAFHLIGLVVVLSMIAHASTDASTDVSVARLFERRLPDDAENQAPGEHN